jgi:hypothetical protein
MSSKVFLPILVYTSSKRSGYSSGKGGVAIIIVIVAELIVVISLSAIDAFILQAVSYACQVLWRGHDY